MNNIKQALKSAIKAMLSMEATIARNLGVSISDDEANAVLECKAALAELDKCEPVKGVIISEGSPTLLSDKYIKATDIRLYTSPQQQQWVGLSEEQDSILIQALTDPENQPSQFGTVPLEWYENLESKHERMRLKVNEIIDSLEGSYEKHAIRKVLQEAIESNAPTIPRDGWVSVPIEPTEEMKRALFRNLIHADDEAYVIKAIIAAAPTDKE